jgi:hypothetical protein
LKLSLEFADVNPRSIVICGTKNIGQRNKEQRLVWKSVLVIKPEEVLELLTKGSAPTNSRKIINTTQIQS